MPEKCTVYCLNESCTYYRRGRTIFGACTHPFHQNLRPCNERKNLCVETCPWKNPPQRLGHIPKERLITAMLPRYIIPAMGASGPSPYKLLKQMLTVKRYRSIDEKTGIINTYNPWEEAGSPPLPTD